MIQKVFCLVFAWHLVFLSVHAKAQQNSSASKLHNTNSRYLEIGIGLPTIVLQENVSSSLGYTGTSPLGFHVGSTKRHANKMFKQFCTDINFITAKPNIQHLTNWNKPASIYAINFLYRNVKGLSAKKNSKWHYYAGASLGLNGQVSIIPAVNNTLSYNFNWLQLGAEAMVTRDFQWQNKIFQFAYQASLPIAVIGVRPQSYVGLQPTPAIWQQDGSGLATIFTEPKFSSLHNNFMFRNDVSLDVQLRKNKLRLIYIWQFTSNTVAVNSLTSVLSSFNVAYLFKLKNK
jgi:hypothetical protein